MFTDTGRKSKKAACEWQSENQWQKHIILGEQRDSIQNVELKAVCWAFGNLKNMPVNIVSDSLYVAGVAQHIEDALLRETKNRKLGELFVQLCTKLQQREQEFCIMHIWSHQWNTGLCEGNA